MCDDEFDDLEIELSFPSGLYAGDDLMDYKSQPYYGDICKGCGSIQSECICEVMFED